jgi:hypothetical protein
MPPIDQDALIRDAVAVMTDWAAGVKANTNAFPIDTVLRIADERSPDDEVGGLLHVVAGLGSLCGLLLVLRENETGASMHDTLRIFRRRWAG